MKTRFVRPFLLAFAVFRMAFDASAQTNPQVPPQVSKTAPQPLTASTAKDSSPTAAALRFARLQAPFAQPLREVLDGVGRRFGVAVECRGFSPDTCSCRYAEARVRPYSLEETLDNLLKPLDLKWERNGSRIRVRPYEYHRRTPADGARLLAWLSSLYADRTAWEVRAAALRADARAILDLEPFLRAAVAEPQCRLGRPVRHDGYTTRNYALETLPGLYVCGTIYAPIARGRHPLIVSPAGHWPEGRYRPDQQYRMATFARMGAVAVDADIVAWGESEQQLGIEAHQAPYAMQVQVLWSKLVTDWILRTRDDIDTTRMAATGGSGGATHTLLLALVDDRFSVLAPVVHLVSHFDGGCPCESGRPVAWAAGGSCTTELLAAVMAPRPVLTVSDGGDWTHTYPTLEYPFLQRIWGFYGAERNVENAHFPDEKHDYGPNKRAAVYRFFAERLGLDASRIDERKVDLQPVEALQSFTAGWPEGAIRSAAELERMLEKIR